MKISIITVFPEIHETFLRLSIIGRAIESGLVSINLVKLSNLCAPKERIDEPTVGPGSGMIIKPEVIARAIAHCEQQWGQGTKVFFSPQGRTLTQRVLRRLATKLIDSPNPARILRQAQDERVDVCTRCELVEPFKCTEDETSSTSTSHLILVCSRYEGIDARVEASYADLVISIGDYVLMGGDVPAQVFLEGFLRLLPGVVGKSESVEKESFSGPFLDHPEYGLPVEWNGMKLPDIIQSGNHAAIEQWRLNEACKKTVLQRFDWFASAQPKPQDIKRATANIPAHYVVLMHTQVKLKDGTIGNTSVTSIDLHDTARSCSTYGVKNFFMVSPLADQQSIMSIFLDFWQSEQGKYYNSSRHHAVGKVRACHALDEVIQTITQQEGISPLLIATSAKIYEHEKTIDYASQARVWQNNRPVLFIFGTGQGLEDALIERSDFLLVPVQGMTDYNHLSVRSAIAIILDRWLGLHPRLE